MGEIGIMVSRLQQEGFDLEDMIDEELRAAGFLELCERYSLHVMFFRLKQCTSFKFYCEYASVISLLFARSVLT